MGLKFVHFSDAAFYMENPALSTLTHAFLDAGYDLIDSIEIRSRGENSIKKGVGRAVKSHKLVVATLPDAESYTPEISEWINRTLFPDPTRYEPFLVDGVPEGFFWEQEGEKLLLILSRNPSLFEDILHYLRRTYPEKREVVLDKVGILKTERWLVEKLTRSLEVKSPQLMIRTFTFDGIVWVVAACKNSDQIVAKQIVDAAISAIREGFGPLALPRNINNLEEAVQKAMIEKGLTLSLAESCTGGHVSASLTKVPGCSDYFFGSIVSYSNLAKETLLNVPSALLEKYGAVSEEVAEAMAKGAQEAFGSDLALSITGIAGPLGGTDEKPVGTVYTAIAWSDGSLKTKKYQLAGGRAEIIAQTKEQILIKLLTILI